MGQFCSTTQGESPKIELSVIPSSHLDAFYDKYFSRTSVQWDHLIAEAVGFPSPGVLALEKAVMAVIREEEEETYTPVRSILKIVRKRYKCFGILEEPYFDQEEREAYAAFYAQSFTPYRRQCQRIHFFEGNDGEAENLKKRLETGVRQKDFDSCLKKLELRYRGFFVLRPGQQFVVGRTAIEFDYRSGDELAAAGVEMHYLEKTGRPYCTTSISNAIHLSSVEINVETAPSIQQNPALGVCATASVWVASTILAHRFGLRKFPYHTITRQALTGEMASSYEAHNEWKFGQGHTPDEIKAALSYTGATALKFLAPAEAPPSKWGVSSSKMRLRAYTFVESGIPVIMCYFGERGGHVVTAVGHLLPGHPGGRDAADSSAESVFGDRVCQGRHHLIGLGVQLYYAHNDAYGPFDRIQFVTGAAAKAARKSGNEFIASAPCLLARRRDPNRFVLRALIVGLPPYLQNHPELIMLDAIRRFDVLFPPKEGVKDKVLWRCLLAGSPDFKQSVMTRKKYSPELRRRYVSCHFPLYVWVVEFTVVPEGKTLPYGPERVISGEFLYDTTTPLYEPSRITERSGSLFRVCRESDHLERCGREEQEVECYVPLTRKQESSPTVERSSRRVPVRHHRKS